MVKIYESNEEYIMSQAFLDATVEIGKIIQTFIFTMTSLTEKKK